MKKIVVFITVTCLIGCGKKLNLKPDSKIVIPSTTQELEKILDNTDFFNYTPDLPQISADEYFIPTLQNWQALTTSTARNASIWQKDIYGGEMAIDDWRFPYSAIYYANNVLDILNSQDISNDTEKQRLKGWALFARSYSFFSLVGTFSKVYNPSSAATDFGIPLKLNGRIDEIVPRSSVAKTYDQIIRDAMDSSELLQPNIVPGKRNRPSKVAAYAFLARVFISMASYDQAENYADKTLEIYSKLTDFNTLNKTASAPFTYDAEETIYFSRIINRYTDLTSALVKNTYGISSELLNLYDPSDLRLQIYFQKNTIGNYNIKRINTLNTFPFSGIATDEIYLIKAECLARSGQTAESLEYLNQLISKRWNPNATGTFKPYQNITASNSEIALEEILAERRRSLVFRGLRWSDLKRLNLEGRNITLTRKLDNQIYILEPNSSRYVMPIPDNEVALSGIQQNIRQ